MDVPVGCVCVCVLLCPSCVRVCGALVVRLLAAALLARRSAPTLLPLLLFCRNGDATPKKKTDGRAVFEERTKGFQPSINIKPWPTVPALQPVADLPQRGVHQPAASVG